MLFVRPPVILSQNKPMVEVLIAIAPHPRPLKQGLPDIQPGLTLGVAFFQQITCASKARSNRGAEKQNNKRNSVGPSHCAAKDFPKS